ncbi:MAG: hypothetical protein KTR31_29370 [Myxococcales bacterium]|nr:hypothetical protein [Myxococcales bacterium]
MRRWLLEMSVLPELRVGDVLRVLVETHGGGPRKSVVTRACNQANGQHTGRLSSDVADYHVTRLGRGPTGLVMVESDADEETLARLAPAVDEVCPVRFARIADAEFEYWQNAADQLLYRNHPKRLQGLLLVDNGLPPPLNQQVVDTSRNPGRRRIRNEGLVEGLGHRMWFGADYPRVMRQTVEALRRFGGEWSEEHPGLWHVRWHPTPIVETSDRDVFRRMELFRENAFGDPMERAPVATAPPRGSVAHKLRVTTPDAEARRSLEDWAACTDGITTRQASRITNPKTGEVIQDGDDLVRWHDHSDGWRREFPVGPRGLLAIRPDAETADFLREVAVRLSLPVEETVE